MDFNSGLNPAPVEKREVYIAMGLPDPFIAFQRARDNAQYYVRGKWTKTWWEHRIEPKAAEMVGISLLKVSLGQYAYERFLSVYASLAAELDNTDNFHVEVCQYARNRQLNVAEQQLRLEKLKKETGLWN
ncbi:MAG: hypothetical protein Q8N34_03305 [Gammaproteobacteria bacterium]|nr:hypothetical protein [Gammaproteobacteria bacterium]